MTSAGTAAVTAANTLINQLQNEPSNPKHVTIHCCEANATNTFNWLRIRLMKQTPPSGPGLRMGVEMVQSTVTSVLQGNVRMGHTQHHCLFCTRALALDDEYFVYLYRPVTRISATDAFAHIMIVTYFCPSAECIAAKDQWLKALRDSDTPDSVRHCSACGARSGPAGQRWLACTGCKMVNYCSETCQRAHWTSMHKQFCKSFIRNIEPKK